MPKNKPSIVEIPKMNYIAVRGKGNPNEEDGDYKNTIGLLYGVAYTIKMSYKGTYKIDGFFEYVVPPLEGIWWQENIKGMDYSRKDDMQFISIIRLPDFVSKEDFDWAIEEATKKVARFNASLSNKLKSPNLISINGITVRKAFILPSLSLTTDNIIFMYSYSISSSIHQSPSIT